MEKEILIRKANADDLDGIFNLYNNYMFDSYLLNLGRAFVRKYLEIIINSRDCITLVAVGDGLVGFITATLNNKKLMPDLSLNIKMLYIWVRQLIVRPLLTFKGMELFFYPFRACLKNVYAEFLFISVEPAYRRANLGENLINETLNLMKHKGIKKVKVSTVTKNEPVNSLLKKLRFKIEKTFTLFKKDMYLYSYTIP